jgi:HPt (histidine-containing phosphotransfer) domain-containing protein
VGRDWSSLIDTGIITTGIALLCWVFIIRPYTAATGIGLPGRSVLIAYPVGDVLVLALMLRLLLDRGARSRSLRLILSAVCMMLTGDLFWAIVSHTTFEPGPILTALVYMNYQVAYALLGGSALDPSVREIAKPAPRESRVHPLLLGALAAGSLVAPAVLLVEALRHQVLDGVAIAVGSTAGFSLVIARMAQLLRRIEERTQQLSERNRAVRLVLDTINEGLLRVFTDGTLAEERSAIVDRWFGPFSSRARLIDYLGSVDAEFCTWFRLGLEAWREGVLPPELCLEQLPRRLNYGPRVFTVGYLPVGEGADAGLLLVINEVTDQVMMAQQEAEQRELLSVFQGFARDRAGLLSFFQQADQMLEQLGSAAIDLPTRRRLLHTLKGNSALVGLQVIAQLCHEAEGELGGHMETIGVRPAMLALSNRWELVTGTFRDLVGERGDVLVELQREDLDQLCEEIRRGLPLPAVITRVEALRCEPVRRSLERLARHARAQAERLGKGAIEVTLEAAELRLDPTEWRPFWADLVHVVNNAVDHGLEPPEQRASVGKPVPARLRLGTQLAPDELVIEVEDDGRGIDWAAIRQAALDRGLPGETSAELLAALLAPGVSSRTESTLISGRGVGMAAVHARVRERGGRIAVSSRAGQGTCWRLHFPRTILRSYEGGESLRSVA